MMPLKGVSSNRICRYCGKRLANRRKRNIHENSIHRKKRFECRHCPKTFTACSSLSRHAKKDHPEAEELDQQFASQETAPWTQAPTSSPFASFNAAHPSTAGPSTGPFTPGPPTGPITAGPSTGPFTATPSTADPFAAGPSANVHHGGAYNPALYGLGQTNPFYGWMNLPTHNPAPHQMNPPANNSAPDQPNPPANSSAPDQTNNPPDLEDHFDQSGRMN